VPQVFEIGQYVEFDSLNSDPKRPGKFRTESARVVEGGLVTIEPNSKAVAIADLMKRHPYHQMAKNINPDDVAQAIANQPLKALFETFEGMKADDLAPDNIARVAKEFLEETFAALTPLGVSHNIDGDVDQEKEEEKINEAIKLFQDNGMHGQINSVRSEYEQFKGVRDAFTLMRTSGLLSMDSVIPMSCLPEMLVAAPVWYVHAKQGLQSRTSMQNPSPDYVTRFFCDLGQSKSFSHLYQMYNLRNRPLGNFSGRDIMSPAIMKILAKAKETFDFIVIMTPYHDLASTEWANAKWNRNVDPFLIGFMKGIPYMFLLARWSGNGLLPLFADMVADTINHLRLNKDKLKKIPGAYDWYMGDGSIKTLDGRNDRGNDILEPFADQVIEAFEDGNLFDFLAGRNLASVPATRQ
jgi:hypothetical protein